MSQDSSPLGNTFTPPPSAFPVTPRKVRLRSRPYIPSLVILFLATIAFGLCPATILPLTLSTTAKWVGVTAPGEVTKKVARGNRRVSHAVLFQFQIDGETHHSEVYVDPVTNSRIKVGDPVTISAFSFWPSMSASIVEPDVGTPSNVYAASCITLVLNGALVFVICIFVGRALIRRNLARFGKPALGKVVLKEVVKKNKAELYRLTYRFAVGETERDGTMDVTRKEYNCISTGQAVTILYDPAKPENSIVYCFGDYEILRM